MSICSIFILVCGEADKRKDMVETGEAEVAACNEKTAKYLK
jgi:hypothetical protein